MYIRFKELTIKNFLSFGNDITEINLDDLKGLNYIVGKNYDMAESSNGAGKSAVFVDALFFAIYGTTARKAKQEEIVNWMNNRDCEVTLNFEIDSKPYRIERRIKPKDKKPALEFYRKGKKIETSNKIKLQKEIENTIDLDQDAFLNLVVLNVNSFQSFFDLDPQKKRDVIENIFGVSIYGDYYEVATEKRREAKRNLELVDNDLSAAKESVVEEHDKLKSLLQKKKQSMEEYKKEIDEINKKIKECSEKIVNKEKVVKKKKELETRKSKLSKKIEEIQDGVTKLNEKLDSLTTEKDETKNKQRDVQRDIDVIVKKLKQLEGDKCPTCNSKIDAGDAAKYKKNLQEQQSKIQKKCDAYVPLLRDLDTKIKEVRDKNIVEKEERIEGFESKTEEINTEIERLDNKLDSIREIEIRLEGYNETKERLLKDKDSDRYDSLIKKNKYEEYKERYKDTKKKRDKYKKRWEALKFLCDIFMGNTKEGTAGIKNYLIERSRPHLNKKVSYYLNQLKANYSITFDGDLNPTLLLRDRYVSNYNIFSSGQRKRIDMAFLFAIKEIANLQNSVETNILVLDEILDSSICQDGINELLSILTSIVKGDRVSVFVISHKSEIRSDRFDRRIRVVMRNGFSSLEVGID